MRQFKVGDIVQIKSWEEMESEYELDDDGDIFVGSISRSFVKKMKYLCNVILEVKKIEYDDDNGNTYFEELSSGWCIYPEMVHFLDEVTKQVLPEHKFMTIIMPL